MCKREKSARWQLHRFQSRVDIALPSQRQQGPCQCTALTFHPLATEMGYAWIVLTGAQFWCFNLKQINFFIVREYENLVLVQQSFPRAAILVRIWCRWEA